MRAILLPIFVTLQLFIGCMGLCQAASNDNMRLFGRSLVTGYQVDLSEADQRWLTDKRVLRIGVSLPDYPPLDIIANNRDYEGITADYASLLEQLLGVRVEVKGYLSRREAIEALKLGEIDLLGSSNDYDIADPALVLSEPYATDQPTLVTRIGEDVTYPVDLAGVRVATVYHYLPEAAINKVYPGARLQLYPSTLSAMGAVAFGQADVFLGNAIGANYLVNRNYRGIVRLVNFAHLDTASFSFALVKQNPTLLRLVNRALDAIPKGERMTILQRWGADEISIPGEHRLQLSTTEQQWLSRHPTVRVLIDDSLLPFTYLDEQNRFRGLSADVLDNVSQRTGLKFEIKTVHSREDQVAALNRGDADMLAAFSSGQDQGLGLSFTRPYFTTSFVLLTKNSVSSPGTLDQLAGQTVAFTDDRYLRSFLTEHYPAIHIVETDNATQALAMVANGQAQAAISSLISARYLLSRDFKERLKITSTVGTSRSQIAFATIPDELELNSILNKALLSIPPGEMDTLAERWRSELVFQDGYWLRYRGLIIQGFIVAGILLIVAITWITYLKRLVYRREQAERALSDQMEFMRVLIDETPHPIYVRDRAGKLISCNASYLEVFGRDMESLLGKRLVEGSELSPAEALEFDKSYQQVMRHGRAVIGDRLLTLANGKTRTIYHWALPYRGSNGMVSGLIAGWIDVSDRQRLLDELKESKEEAENANRAKTTFLATMSHEIRTPMNAVIGMLELAMKKGDQGIMDRLALDVASGAARDLLDLIGGILDIARIEAGKLTLTPERARVRSLIESTVRIFEGLAQQKGIALVLEVQEVSRDDALVDPLRLKQVLSNLVGNAIKFTERGEVRVSYRSRQSEDGQRLRVEFDVTDSGIGISDEDQMRLFTPFSQARGNRNAARTGSGLGLVISRSLCEMMGGTLTLTSQVGKGTRVSALLEFPLLEPADDPGVEQVTSVPAGARLRVLVVDDYPVNRMLLSQQLEYLGHRVEEAVDGVHGLQVWGRKQFDVVITDCHMPRMTGYELASAIREDEKDRNVKACLLLGFTANALPEERQRCLAAGMDGCLFKPITLHDLQQRLSGVEPPRQVPPLDDGEDGHEEGDWGALLKLTGGNKQVARGLLIDLARSNKEDLALLETLQEPMDASALKDLAHRVKGGARIIKASRLMEACESLEFASINGERDQVTQAAAELAQAMTQLRENLDRQIG
ncbi:transporter substrate-binding domain-containing protein [Pseudomonas sp. P1.31]|jgi:two-component system sensor histidine kinase EvgS|uniref:transporter substrate-binding domain-containing protein n=1 Tax=Pseudomonas sp. P1.31 TaxID=1699311 RepID=UPI0009EB0DFC|nr:transporter substrate-binding domain-containing protein [Pseudomonas sp. P1.31]